jgi:DNA-binding SARP family transcriptional activator/TolB-like protein
VALLAYLALRAAHGPERRDTLLGMFWPESSTNHARGALRNALHFLRGALGPGAIRSVGSEEVHLDPDLIWCDAVEFDRLCDTGDLAGALLLYDGDLLEGFFISEAPGFEHWVDGERARLRERAADAARTLAAEAEATGETGLAIVRLRHLLALAPTDEVTARHLMRLLAAADDRGRALGVYADLETRLQDEYGLEPSAETRALAHAIRDRESTGALPPPDPTAAARRESGGAIVETAPAPEAPVSTGPGAPAPAPAARRWSALMAGAAAAVAVGFIAAALFSRSGAPDVGAPDVLAVLPFEYRGAPEHAYLAEGLADLLATNLNGAGDLRVVDPRAVLPAAQSLRRPIEPAAARREAAAHGAGLFVLGAITEAAGQLRVAASIYGPETGPRPALTDVVVQGNADDLLTLADRLTFALLEGRGGATTLAGATLRTTGSVPALKAFLRGEAALRTGDMQEAIDQYRQATELDSTFALAHYRLSSAAYRQGIARIPGRSAATALRHAGRLAREDSLLVAAWNHHVEGSAGEAHRLYREALVLRPGHVEAEFQLGELIFHWGSSIGIPASTARDPFNRVLAVEPTNVDAAVHLARIAARDGRLAELDSLALAIRRLDPAGDWARELDQLRAFLSTDPAWQDRVVAAAAGQPGQDRAVLERAAALSYNLAAVERVAQARLRHERNPDDQARFQLFLAQVQLARGRYRDAVSGIEAASVPTPRRLEYRAMMASLPFLPVPADEVATVRTEIAAHSELAPEDAGGPVTGRGIEYPHLLWPGLHRVQRLYLLGALHAALGDGAAAEAVADSLARFAPDRLWASSYERLTRARAAVAAGQPRAALRILGPVEPPARRTFESLVDHGRPYERWLRAEVLRQTGRSAEALRWYATFPDPVARDLAYLAPSHLRRAEIHEAAGSPDQAAFHYRRFIDLWADADPELQPEVSRARERLVRLTSR